ncbi:MAG TPA: hypothetical protein VIL88_13985 [Devosia sp.]|jgi:hypothetical protein|uniref:hypothetical protein n=1 Tax=Devosia sp. TaxID=1871048 RepID=UPI002F922DBA
MKRAIIGLLAGLVLVGLAGPSTAQPLTYQVDLLYEKIVDGVRPKTFVRVTIPATSPQAVDAMCGSTVKLIKLGRRALENGPEALGLQGNWMAGGGKCVMDAEGEVEMTIQGTGGSR